MLSPLSRDTQKQKAVKSAMKRTIKWYDKAATAKFKKQKAA
jgi:hypothetical protein